MKNINKTYFSWGEWQRAVSLFLALALVWSGCAKVFADSSAETELYPYEDAIALAATAGYDLPSPETVESKYGEVSACYYKMGLASMTLAMEGKVDVASARFISGTDLDGIRYELQTDGKLGVSTRHFIRIIAIENGVDQSLIPFDEDFYARTAYRTTGKNDLTDSEKEALQVEHEAFRQEWEGSFGNGETKPVETPVPTATPVPTSTPAPVLDTGFADVAPDAWYAEAVAGMKNSGIIVGKDDGLFHPDDTITIAEWCTLLYRAGSLPGSPEGGVNNGGTIYTHWATRAVSQCSVNGVTCMNMTKGLLAIPENAPCADVFAQRGEALNGIIELIRKAEKNGYVMEKALGTASQTYNWNDIPDAARVQEGVEASGFYMDRGEKILTYAGTHYWNADNILLAYNLGITNGVDSTGTCNPEGLMTRAQACKMLYDAGLRTRTINVLWTKGNGGGIVIH